MDEFRPPSVVADDTRLAVALRDGDEDAVRSLVARFGGLVYAVAFRVLGDPQLAEDVTQQTFLHAWRRRDDFEPGRDFAPWLSTISRHAAIDVLRRERRRPSEPLDRPGGSRTDDAPGGEGPDASALERIWSVRAAIESLDPAERDVVRLQHLEQWTHAEIAEHLGVSIGTVKSRSYRAHRRLAGRLRHLRDQHDCDHVGATVAGMTTGNQEDEDGRD